MLGHVSSGYLRLDKVMSG